MICDFTNVTLKSGFLKELEERNSKITVNAVYDRFCDTGRIEAFSFGWKQGDPNPPHFFWDSDVAKWMEGAAYIIAREGRDDLREKVESLIDQIIKNQYEDGYFNIYYTLVEPNGRWKIRDRHELYCAGHLIEAACAYYEATGEDRFLRAMEKYVEHINRVFVVERSANFITPGHEEIELALYRLYKLTKKQEHLELCRFFLEKRGRTQNEEDKIFGYDEYAQSHLPVREQHEAVGHAVRAVYLYCAMADMAKESGDQALKDACVALFNNIVGKKMYITGGIGSTIIGEAFTAAYDLPNATAYSETCAAIGMIFFAHRMMSLDPKNAAKYADVIERELYNGATSGVSRGGEGFFYTNPLEICLADHHRLGQDCHKENLPIIQRVKVFECSCCPPNIVRLMSSLGNYVYALDEQSGRVYINQFADSEYQSDGAYVRVKTDYPKSGVISVLSNVPTAIRIPGWCKGFGTSCNHTVVDGYIFFEAGEQTVEFTMPVTLMASSVRVSKNIGKVAVCRGPEVFCAEACDNGGDVHRLCLNAESASSAVCEFDPQLGANVLKIQGGRRVDSREDMLYLPYEKLCEPTEIRMIPYRCFANRGETDMLVYLNI